MSKIKNGGLDQYGAEPFEQQQLGTAGVEGVNLAVCTSSASVKVVIVTELFSPFLVVNQNKCVSEFGSF